MLRIRLQRSGRKKRPNYRVVVAEHSAPIQGRYNEMVGTFDPLIEKHGLVVDTAKVEEWVKKGAKPTNTVARLLKGQGMKGMEPFIVDMKDRAIKNPKEAPEAPASPVAEAPAVTPAEPVPEVAAEEAAPAVEEKEETSAETAAPAEEEKPAEESVAEEEVKEPAEDAPEEEKKEESA